MIAELAKRDKHWRKVALSLCKDKSMADDIVQEMYLRMHEVKRKYEEINDFYIIVTMRNIFYQRCRKANKKEGFDLCKLVDSNNFFEPSDREAELIDRFNELPWHERELMLETADKSLRDLGAEIQINYQFIHRTVTAARKKILND